MSGTSSEQLRLMARRHPGAEAFVDLTSGAALSFSAWDVAADRLAVGMAALGVGRGERVLLAVGAGPATAWVVAHTAIHRCRAVVVPVNTFSSAPELRRVVEHCQPAAAVVSPDQLRVLAAAGGLAGPVVVVDGRPHVDRVPSAGSRVVAWSEVVALGERRLAGGERVADADGAEPEEISDIVYTSGTTGRPKGVVVRHANASVIPNGCPPWSGSGWLSCSPLFTFAGTTAVYNPMRLGMTSLYLARFDPAEWVAQVQRRRPAMVFLVPAMAELLVRWPGIEDADLSSVGLCAVGSAPLAPATQQRLAELMPAASVSNAYGMTEAGPAYTVLPKEETRRRQGSVGRPVPPAEFSVVDLAGRRLPPGEVGELVVSLPGRQREYYRDPEATAAAWRSDGLHTGDLARIDDDGYVYVVGRVKDVIIRGGHNVHAGDVEAALLEHPAVLDVAVAGIPHPVLGEEVAAWLVLSGGAQLSAEDVTSWASCRLAGYKVPTRVRFVAELPRNANGKVVKHALAALEQSRPG